MEAKVTLCGGMRFVGQADSGHAVVMDTTAANGGADGAVRPNELLLIGLAGCTGMDVISILRKKRQPVTGLEIVVSAELTAAPPKRMTSICVAYRVRGTGVDPAAVRRAIELSEQTYCSVGLTLKSSVPIASSFTIEDETGTAPV
jgi:putative redox protein